MSRLIAVAICVSTLFVSQAQSAGTFVDKTRAQNLVGTWRPLPVHYTYKLVLNEDGTGEKIFNDPKTDTQNFDWEYHDGRLTIAYLSSNPEMLTVENHAVGAVTEKYLQLTGLVTKVADETPSTNPKNAAEPVLPSNGFDLQRADQATKSH